MFLSVHQPRNYSSGMKSGCLYLLAFFAFTSSASEQTNELSHAELRRALHEHVSQPRFESALWGVKVVSKIVIEFPCYISLASERGFGH